MRLDLSGPLSRKRLVFSSQAIQQWSRVVRSYPKVVPISPNASYDILHGAWLKVCDAFGVIWLQNIHFG
jgi:hypothetical protein